MKRTLVVLVFAVSACGGGSSLSPLQQTTPSTTPATPEETPDANDDETPNTTATDPTFGSACETTAECGTGLVCSGLVAGATICTTPCVGSGKGGNDDCPSGYACLNYESTTLDGIQICLADWQLGASAPGYPFTTPPGGACTETDNACQTGVCNSDSQSCVVMCMADRDCASGEVCYAYAVDDGYLHVCWASDTTTYAATGESCTTHDDCDSGVCADGVCANHCRTFGDCASGTACNYYPMSGTSGWTPVCTSGAGGSASLGATCSNDNECASTWCLDGLCTTPCATRDDCGDLDCIQVNFSSPTAIAYSGSLCR